MKRPKIWDKLQKKLDVGEDPLVVSEKEWDEYFETFTPAVKENYTMMGFYIYRKKRLMRGFKEISITPKPNDIIAMAYKGCPVVRRDDYEVR